MSPVISRLLALNPQPSYGVAVSYMSSEAKLEEEDDDEDDDEVDPPAGNSS